MDDGEGHGDGRRDGQGVGARVGEASVCDLKASVCGVEGHDVGAIYFSGCKRLSQRGCTMSTG